jgi:hypothetical protein
VGTLALVEPLEDDEAPALCVAQRFVLFPKDGQRTSKPLLPRTLRYGGRMKRVDSEPRLTSGIGKSLILSNACVMKPSRGSFVSSCDFPKSKFAALPVGAGCLAVSHRVLTKRLCETSYAAILIIVVGFTANGGPS